MAYHVPDFRKGALEMAQTLGAGPFFVNERIELSWGEHRGKPTNFVHASAYGQWGSIMVECFSQLDSSSESPYRDMFSADQSGLHHTAMMVDDMAAAFEYFERQGWPVVTRCGLSDADAVDFAFIDARATLGHMIEIYPKSERLLAFYQHVRDAADGWQGEEPLRSM